MPKAISSPEPQPLARRLAAYGCTNIIRLDEKLTVPEQLDYLDLLPTRANETPKLAAVAAHQGSALLYIVDSDGDTNPDPSSLAKVSRQLANRSDPAWLGVVRPGSLEIFPIGFHEPAKLQPIKIIEESSKTAPFFFQSLVHGTFDKNDELKGTDYVYRKIFDLLMQTTEEFVPKEGNGKIDSLEVLSMAGRALFFRFLIDRRIVLEKELYGPEGICPAASELKDAFSTSEKAAQTSAWLDSTFNGDFLPLINEAIAADDRKAREIEYLKFYQRTEHLVGKTIFTHLHAILRGWRSVGNAFQLEIDWGDFDFAHIPVGVLSQVYESFSHRADPRTARDTSVHYTPRTIASLMVEEAFAGVKEPADAKILDSACGAGTFLVLAFRRLVRERWLRDEERPRTAAIQDILYEQVRGFDISESALRLAALALYITAIELNATPRPPQSLKFPRNIRGEVLYRFGSEDKRNKSTAFSLGSLGPEVSSNFNKAFDIVIGNPPWTRLRDEKPDHSANEEERLAKSATDELNKEFTEIGRRVLKSRGLPDLAKRYRNPDKNPDLPFLWRATEWAKDDGVIALAMHPRLFMRIKGNGRYAWIAILRSIQVTGILNGSDLRKTGVWEGMDAPFSLFFARNTLPKPDQRFHFASPVYEPELNGRGRFRIDYEAAHQISSKQAEELPWLLKTLSLGTWLDVEVMETLANQPFKPLGELWAVWDSKGDRTGQGFNRSPDLKQKPTDFLADLKVFKPAPHGFSIDYSILETYAALFGVDSQGQSSAHMPRRKELYQPPLVIIPKAPGEDELKPKAYISSQALAFSQSHYGYSCADNPEADTFASLIYILSHSKLFRYFALMTSTSQGVDYMLFTKQDFDALPFPDIGKLSLATKPDVRNLAHRLEHATVKPWQDLDAFIFRLYGLDDDMVQVVNDTLFFAGAYRNASKAAHDPTTTGTRADFVETVRAALQPYFDVVGDQVDVREAEFQPDTWREPWFFLAVSRKGSTVPVNSGLMRKAMELANQRGCSRIIVNAPGNHGLLLGLLNQRRWWTTTRARMCAQHIIRERLEACGLPEGI
jgi:hypothetical protein